MTPVRSAVGNLLTDKGNILGRWTEHFDKLLNRPSNIDAEDIDNIPQRPMISCLDDQPTAVEVQKAAKHLQPGKAAGPDGIPPEIYNEEGDTLVSKLTELLQHLWLHEELLQELKDANIVHLFKNEGDKSICDKHRDISLLSIAGKIFDRLRQHRMDDFISESQCGFRRNRGTIDMIFAVRQIQEKCREQHQDLYFLFIDLTKAFDTVCRTGLWLDLTVLQTSYKWYAHSTMKCADYDVSDKEKFPTFARTFPPATQVAKPIVSLLLKYNWNRFSLVIGSEHKWMVISDKIRELAALHNMTINSEETFEEPYMPLTSRSRPNPFPGIVERTFVGTRVYVFLGTYNAIVDMMTNLFDRGLLDTGEYVVIYYDDGAVDSFPTQFFRRTTDAPISSKNEEAVRSLFVVTGSFPSDPHYDEFKTAVREYREKEPFNFPNPFQTLNITGKTEVTVYAAYLYDATMLYAQSLHKVIEEGGDVTNGTAIILNLLGKEYKGIQGYMTRIDENGDAEGNFTLLSRQPFKSNYSDYSMKPVGHFEMTKDGGQILPVFKLFWDKQIYWVAGEPPTDEPDCGYHAERCIPIKTYTPEIVMGILGGIAFIAGIATVIAYRAWRYEQEIAGLSWKIHREDIKTPESLTGSDRRHSLSSRMTLSQLSMDSKLSYNQVYARTGGYKGQIVALKMYEKKNLYVNRKMQKEMKLMRDLRHNNINTFLGACIDSPYLILVTEYCPKGSLMDILENEDVKLDSMFVASLVKNIIQGMTFLHDSEIQFHGNLKSSNCVVTSRWSLQITDFGLLEVRAATYKPEDEHAYFRNLFWKSPECLPPSTIPGSPKADVYAFGIILYEIFGRTGPFGFCQFSPRKIVEQIKSVQFRPDTKILTCDNYIVECMHSCWVASPDMRPDFRLIRKLLAPLHHGMKRNIFDNMMSMMEKYQKNLEDLVDERTTLLIEEKKKTESLLLRMLPKCVADQLKIGEAVIPEAYSSVTIYFSDICGFTELSAKSTPMEVVSMLNDLYTVFDNTIRNFDVYKIETIGDAYMVCSGLPLRNGDNHAGEIASMSLRLLKEIKKFKVQHRPEYEMSLRIGIHSGPCVAGVVGLTMPRYTLFGDTVNTASRMETNGAPMKVHCSVVTKTLLDKLGGYTVELRGSVAMKGKGEMLTYWLTGESEHARQKRIHKDKQTLNNIQRSHSQRLGSQSCNRPVKDTNPKRHSDLLNRRSFTYDSDGSYKSVTPTLLRAPQRASFTRSNSAKNISSLKPRSTTSNSSFRSMNQTCCSFMSTVNGIISDKRSASGSNLLMKVSTLHNHYGDSNTEEGESETLLINDQTKAEKSIGKRFYHSSMKELSSSCRDSQGVGSETIDITDEKC